MAFCPECGKPVTADAAMCASCGFELEAKPAGGAKTGAARFKGTMLMATTPAVTPKKPKPNLETDATMTAQMPVVEAATQAGTATTPSGQAAPAGAAAAAAKAQAKSTMIGTGLGAFGGSAGGGAKPAGAATPAGGASAAGPAPSAGASAAAGSGAGAFGAAAASASGASAAQAVGGAPRVGPAPSSFGGGAASAGGGGPKSTVLGTGIGAASVAGASPAAAPRGVSGPVASPAAAAGAAQAARAAFGESSSQSIDEPASATRPTGQGGAKAEPASAMRSTAQGAGKAEPASAMRAAAQGANAESASAVRAGAQSSATDDSKRNMAYAQTQHHGAFAAAQSALSGANAPRTSPNLGGAAAASDFDAHAETDPPEVASPAAYNATSELREEDLLESRDAARAVASELEAARYLPGDPMAPQGAQPTAANQRAPMLRFDDSIPKVSRSGMDEKKWVWLAGGGILLLCLILVVILASKMGH